MEEKERFKLNDYQYIYDIESDSYLLKDFKIKELQSIVDLLNQQDKRIKELEEESGYLIFSDGCDKNGNEIYRQEFVKYKDKFKELVEENKQLKQSQKQLAIEILEELHLLFRNGICNFSTRQYVCTIIDIQIKELKGEK